MKNFEITVGNYTAVVTSSPFSGKTWNVTVYLGECRTSSPFNDMSSNAKSKKQAAIDAIESVQ